MAMLAPESRLVVMSPLGRFVRKLRKAHGLSCHDLSRLSGVSEATIRQIETTPNYQPERETLINLAQGVELNPESLLVFLETPRG